MSEGDIPEHYMALLREARNNLIAAEQRHNFGGRRRCTGPGERGKPKRIKTSNTWTHKFVCLASTEQEKPCSSITEKNELILAGLGEKKITVPNVVAAPKNLGTASQMHFQSCLLEGGLNI